MMSIELKEQITNLASYYNHHGVEQMIDKHPGFVVDDFTKLLNSLQAEIEA